MRRFENRLVAFNAEARFGFSRTLEMKRRMFMEYVMSYALANRHLCPCRVVIVGAVKQIPVSSTRFLDGDNFAALWSL